MKPNKEFPITGSALDTSALAVESALSFDCHKIYREWRSTVVKKKGRNAGFLNLSFNFHLNHHFLSLSPSIGGHLCEFFWLRIKFAMPIYSFLLILLHAHQQALVVGIHTMELIIEFSALWVLLVSYIKYAMPIYYFLLILLHVAARACMQVVIGIHTMELMIGCNIIDLSDSCYVLYFLLWNTYNGINCA